MNSHISKCIDQHIQVVEETREVLTNQIAELAKVLLDRIKNEGTIFWCGNGGSAADSQHLAAELIGRFKRERKAISSIALTTDTSALTAIGNDYGYSEIFKRQVEGLVRRGDVLIGISTSGNSENILQAVRSAKHRGATTVCLLGRDGGRLKTECDHCLVVPSDDTARIQECHIMVGHIVCDLIESDIASS